MSIKSELCFAVAILYVVTVFAGTLMFAFWVSQMLGWPAWHFWAIVLAAIVMASYLFFKDFHPHTG